MLDINTIYHGDCLELMRDIPDASIDMILCDLPYGTTQNKWDTVLPLPVLWNQYIRIIKENGVIVLPASQPFTSTLVNSNLQWFKYSIVWDKCLATGFLNAKKQPLRVAEDILVFYKKQPTYNPQFFFKKDKRKMKGMSIKPHSENYGSQKNYTSEADDNMCYPLTIISIPQIRGNGKEKLPHPTQKPIALFEYFIKTYTNEGDTVLDNCVGSGTTAIACLRTNRNYVCMEKEEKYYELTLNRIEDERNLFTKAQPIGSAVGG